MLGILELSKLEKLPIIIQCSSIKKPDAIFVANDHMALTTMDVIRFSLNLSIPNDVAIVGFDDVPPASWPAYNLTTVRQANKMVECTVDIILEK